MTYKHKNYMNNYNTICKATQLMSQPISAQFRSSATI